MESSSSSGSPPADVDLPTGTVSFLFTDREGSTRLLEALGAGYGALIETDRSIVDSSVREHGGLVFETEGDARLAGAGTTACPFTRPRGSARRGTEGRCS